jgi:hypothetical protein
MTSLRAFELRPGMFVLVHPIKEHGEGPPELRRVRAIEAGVPSKDTYTIRFHGRPPRFLRFDDRLDVAVDRMSLIEFIEASGTPMAPHHRALIEVYTPEMQRERAAEKQASRDQDAADLASGRKTREQLTRENGAFAFPPGSVRITYPKGGKF